MAKRHDMDGGVIYFAYGSNMSPAQMESRCPGGQALGQAALHDWRFLINTRTYATIEPEPGALTQGVLWSLTQEHIDSLDIYEAVDEGMYYKDTLTGLHLGRAVEALVYIAPVCEHGQPRPEYLRGSLYGARHFELPPDYVETIARDWGGV